jgi:hypothetical protein
MERENSARADPEPLEKNRATGGMSRAFLRDMLVSGILPWVAVLVLQHFQVPIVRALAISTIFPVADGIFSFVRYRRLDALGIVNLSFILGSIGISLWTGDVHIALLKGALLTAGFSCLCLGSLLAPRPLMFFLGRQFSTRNDPRLIAQWNARWQYPRFRRIMRLITAVWGLGYLLEVLVRVTAAYTLAPMVVIATAPFITYGVFALLMTWTILYSSAMTRKYAATITEGATTDEEPAPNA